MATIKSEYYRFNGFTWDLHYFKTSMDMVDGLTSALSGYVPTTRTINGKALGTNIWLNTAAIGDDDRQQYLDQTLMDLETDKLSTSAISAWAKASTKPSYTWSEIGSKPTNIIRQVSFSSGTLVVEVV